MDVCGLTEVRWKGQGHFCTFGGHTAIYSGNEKQGLYGVAIQVYKRIAEAITSYRRINERMMVAWLNAGSKSITLLQVYALTAVAKEGVEIFYEELEQVIQIVFKGGITMVMGDFNAKVGKTI